MAEYHILWHSLTNPNGKPYIVRAEGRYPRAGQWPVLNVYNPNNPDVSAARASVNTDTPCLPDEVAIKDWGENEGMLEALVTARVVQPPHRWIGSGYVEIPVCRWFVPDVPEAA
jgi:hypothetical protein